MSLSAEDRVRYSRQIMLKEIGVSGQERLRAAQVSNSGRAWPYEEYLSRAGVEIGDEGHVHALTDPALLASDESLRAVSEVLAASLDAVECLKAVLNVGVPADAGRYAALDERDETA